MGNNREWDGNLCLILVPLCLSGTPGISWREMDACARRVRVRHAREEDGVSARLVRCSSAGGFGRVTALAQETEESIAMVALELDRRLGL